MRRSGTAHLHHVLAEPILVAMRPCPVLWLRRAWPTFAWSLGLSSTAEDDRDAAMTTATEIAPVIALLAVRSDSIPAVTGALPASGITTEA